MLLIVLEVFCAIWLASGITVFVLGLLRRRSAKRRGMSTKRDVHDGSNVVAGAIIALMLGPVGLAFFFLDRRRS